MISLESKRLIICELSENDLETILLVLVSDPEHLRRQEGSESEPGRYDLARWQRDWSIGQMMPGRHMLGCYLKDTNEAVGYVEFMEEVDDGKPWFGMLLIHTDYRRRKIGSETCERMMEFFRIEYQWPLIRAWVAEENVGGYAFVQYVGFHELVKKSTRLAGGMQEIVQLEYTL